MIYCIRLPTPKFLQGDLYVLETFFLKKSHTYEFDLENRFFKPTISKQNIKRL